MRVLSDTSVLVAGLVESHPMHALAFPWLELAKAGEIELLISTHSLAELYAVLTRLPTRPRIPPGTAWRLIRENVETPAHVVVLHASDYRIVLERLAAAGLTGGVVYDALIARAAEGSVRDGLSILAQAIAYSSGDVSGGKSPWYTWNRFWAR